MERISVTGGKGGTGKSTVAILIALEKAKNGKKVLLVDADVECPNDSILLGIEELKNVVKDTFVFYPDFNAEKCKKCGLCVEKCRSSALFQPKSSIPVLNKDLCTSCGVCWTICPHNAIEKKKEKNGEIFENKIINNLTLLTARSIPGIRETSPIVDALKEYIEKIQHKFDLAIIDTAAGTHCTVISALDGTDRAIAVTEPTPLGAHDLGVILQVLDKIEIPSEIIINRSDIADNELIEEIADKYEKEIKFKIKYDTSLAQAYSNGNFLGNSDKLLNLIRNYE